MLDEKRLANIIEMEEIANATQKLVDEASSVLQNWERLLPQINKLAKYYQSVNWLEDYEADGLGEIPPNISRGVLSEDGLYNLLAEYDEICREYSTLTSNQLKNNP